MYKKIHQIFISDNDSPIRSQLKTNVEKIRSLYPEYDYNLYNDRMIQEILKNNFNHKTFQAYMDLKPYAFKADLARMCLLYLYGGYYFDIGIDIINRINLDEHDIVMVLGNTDKYHYNSILIENNFCFVKNKKNKIIKSIIDYIVDNVYNLDYNTHPLDITGPLAIGKIIDTKNKNITFCTVKSHSEFFTDEELDDNIVRGRKIAYYRDKMFYYFKHSEFNADLSKMGASGTNNYQKMWHSNEVYDIRFSYIVTSQSKINDHDKTLTDVCIKSMIQNLRQQDEIILLENNNIQHIKNKIDQAKGNIVVFLNSKILLPDFFSTNLLLYIKNNKYFDAWTVQTYLANGSKLLYDHNNILQHYSPIIIMKKYIADQIDLKENLLSNSLNETELWQMLNWIKNEVSIDAENYVFYCDKTNKNKGKNSDIIKKRRFFKKLIWNFTDKKQQDI